MKLEQEMNMNNGFCRCGTPSIELNKDGTGMIRIDQCLVCGSPVKRLTFAEISKAADLEIRQETSSAPIFFGCRTS